MSFHLFPRPHIPSPDPVILLAFGEEPMAQALRLSLEKQNYRVLMTPDGNSALYFVRHQSIDAVVLDALLPGRDGFKVCQAIRQRQPVPVFLFHEEGSKWKGLLLHPTQCETKPFSLRELPAQLEILFPWHDVTFRGEQSGPLAGPRIETLASENLTVHLHQRRVLVDGSEVHFKPREFALLVYLMRNIGIPLSREQLLENVWGQNYRQQPHTLASHIELLRRKIEATPRHPVRIVTVEGYCYRFNG